MPIEIGKSQAKTLATCIHDDIADYIATHKEEFEKYKRAEALKSDQQKRKCKGGEKDGKY